MSAVFEAIHRVPPISWALVLAVLLAALLATARSRRGGSFRGLAGWAGFWIPFSTLLVVLSRAPHVVSFPLLALFMFVTLRGYFSLAPVHTRDRYVVLGAYLAIPFALWPAYSGNKETFLATVPVALFLGIPVFLGFERDAEGLLDSMGRSLLGVLFFVFCLAHLGLLVHYQHAGAIELFGILVLAAELPQRLTGRFRRGSGWALPILGTALSGLLAVAAGFYFGPWCGLVEEDGGRAGLLVAIAVSMGAWVSRAVARDLSMTVVSWQLGRGAIIDRAVPAVYAAPVYFHYLDHFA